MDATDVQPNMLTNQTLDDLPARVRGREFRANISSPSASPMVETKDNTICDRCGGGVGVGNDGGMAARRSNNTPEARKGNEMTLLTPEL